MRTIEERLEYMTRSAHALHVENDDLRAKLALQGQSQMEELDNLKQDITFAIDAAVRKEEKAMQVTWNPVSWFRSGTAIKRWLALIEVQAEVQQIIRKSDGF